MPGQHAIVANSTASANVSTSFVRPCLDCGSTVRVIDTVEQPHDCRPHTDRRDLVAHAYWAGWEAAKASG